MTSNNLLIMIQFLRRKINLSLFYLEVELSLGCKYKSNNLINSIHTTIIYRVNNLVILCLF